MKLPVLATVREAFVVTGRYWDIVGIVFGLLLFIFFLVLWFFLDIAGAATLISHNGGMSDEFRRRAIEYSRLFGYIYLIYFILIFLVVSAAATIWHRRCENGRAAVPAVSILKIENRRWRVLWQVIKLFFVSVGAVIAGLAVSVAFLLIVSNLFGVAHEIVSGGGRFKLETHDPFASSLTFAVFLCVTFGIISRFVMVLPASALDKQPSLRESWRLTRGNGTRLTASLVAVAVIPQIVVGGVIYLMSLFVGSSMGVEASHISASTIIVLIVGVLIVNALVLAIHLGLFFSVFSIAYRHLGEEAANPT